MSKNRSARARQNRKNGNNKRVIVDVNMPINENTMRFDNTADLVQLMCHHSGAKVIFIDRYENSKTAIGIKTQKGNCWYIDASDLMFCNVNGMTKTKFKWSCGQVETSGANAKPLAWGCQIEMANKMLSIVSDILADKVECDGYYGMTGHYNGDILNLFMVMSEKYRVEEGKGNNNNN